MTDGANGAIDEPDSGRGRFWWATAVALSILSAYGFIAIWAAVHRGGTVEFDESVLRSLRRADDPAVPIGPRWLREGALDVTALGSHALLVLVVASAAGFIALAGRWTLAL